MGYGLSLSLKLHYIATTDVGVNSNPQAIMGGCCCLLKQLACYFHAIALGTRSRSSSVWVVKKVNCREVHSIVIAEM